MRTKIIFLGYMILMTASTVNATSDEWSKRWSTSESRYNSNLIQANLIELAESDYYKGLGRNSIYSYSSTYIDKPESTTNIGQYTNSVGAINTSSNDINVSGSDINTNVSNGAVNKDSNVKSGIKLSSLGDNNQCLNLGNEHGGSSSC